MIAYRISMLLNTFASALDEYQYAQGRWCRCAATRSASTPQKTSHTLLPQA